MTEIITRSQRERLCQHLHRLGPRVVFEFVDEIIRAHGLDADVDSRLERYAQLDGRALKFFGGDRFAPRPLHLATGGR